MADDFASLGQLGGPRKKQKVLDASAAALVDLRVELSKKQDQFEKEIKWEIYDIFFLEKKTSLHGQYTDVLTRC